MKLVVDEGGSSAIRSLVGQFTGFVSSDLVRVETRSALARGLSKELLAGPDFLLAKERALALFRRMTLLPVTGAIIADASEFPEEHGLRAYDAMHLASLLATGTSREVQFLCWDKRLRWAAEAEGYTVVPAWPGGVPPAD